MWSRFWKNSFSALAITLSLATLCTPVMAKQPGPQVVVSIKPLHALVAGVMAGVAEPRLLMSGGSPHGYTLRPSEARMLTEAELVIWVGPQLEGFMQKPLVTLGKKARTLELSKELERYLLPIRSEGDWDVHDHDHADEISGHDRLEESSKLPGDDHDTPQARKQWQHTEYNQHLWLDPQLAGRIVAATATVLSEIDPTHSRQYQRNAIALQERLETLHAQLQTRLAPVKKIPYIIFHDAYRYFEAAYSLDAVGSITMSAERKPGAARIAEMREKIIRLNARCVFSEPQFEPRLVTTLIEGTGARTGILDPLGAALPSGPDSYFTLMNNLADNLLAGLQ